MAATPSYKSQEVPIDDPWRLPSRRSVVHSAGGMISCTQPLAAKCGLRILQAGGNAADAAVAVAAGLSVTEPASTGLGGDMFMLFWDAGARQVRALNGSGRAGAKYTLDTVREKLGFKEGEASQIPFHNALAVTVPGAAAGWIDSLEQYGSGKVNLADVLDPAIQLADGGYPVSELTSKEWITAESRLRKASPNFAEILKHDPEAEDGVRAPRAGEMMRCQALAQTLRTLSEKGKEGFYTGRIAEEIVRAVADQGGLLEMEDLAHHIRVSSEPTVPISLKFSAQGLSSTEGESSGLQVWEHAPNGQGIVALMTLGILQELERQGKIATFTPLELNSTAYLHAIIESLRLSFTDAAWYVTDPDVVCVPVDGLLSPAYLAERAQLFDPSRAADNFDHGEPALLTSPALRASDTVYFAVTDAHGNAASFINSNYSGFGTGIVPRGCGFVLQDRGANFSLVSSHPNRLAPRKRPYHTIIPALVTNLADDSLHAVFGVMGGFMQPQGHVQVLLGQVVGQLDPQQALDAPRIFVVARLSADGKKVAWSVKAEDGLPHSSIEGLRKLGHEVHVVRGSARQIFGIGQIIRRRTDPVDGTLIWFAGSDMRGDGAAYPA